MLPTFASPRSFQALKFKGCGKLNAAIGEATSLRLRLARWRLACHSKSHREAPAAQGAEWQVVYESRCSSCYAILFPNRLQPARFMAWQLPQTTFGSCRGGQGREEEASPSVVLRAVDAPRLRNESLGCCSARPLAGYEEIHAPYVCDHHRYAEHQARRLVVPRAPPGLLRISSWTQKAYFIRTRTNDLESESNTNVIAAGGGS